MRKHSGKGRKPKRANRRIHRIPFHKFKQAIQSVAWQHGIDVVEVPATRTSQKCPKCGYTSKKNWVFFNGKRKLFKCKCGYEANVDRTASRNIATLALERGFVAISATLSTHPRVPELGAMSAAPSGSMRAVGNIIPPRQAPVLRREKLTQYSSNGKVITGPSTSGSDQINTKSVHDIQSKVRLAQKEILWT